MFLNRIFLIGKKDLIMKLPIFISVISITTLLHSTQSNEITALLDQYQNSSQNNSKTKKESLGHIISFTANDIYMMQAYKLSDILKTLPITSLQTNMFGVSNLAFNGSPNSVSTAMRLYINNHEVSSLHTLSPWLIYDQYPLDHISHIDIYISEGSLTLGNEPSKITIKLFTKVPETVNGGALRSSFTTAPSQETTLSYASETENFGTLAMINYNHSNYEDENKNNDSNRLYGYFSLNLDQTQIDFGYAKLDKSPYIGLSKDLQPDGGSLNSKDYFVSATKFFNEGASKVSLAVDRNERDYKEQNQEGLLVLPYIQATSTYPTNYEEQLIFTKYDLSLSHEYNTPNNTLFMGTSMKHKDYQIDNRFLNNQPFTKFSEISRESIVSIMAEDNYYFNDNNMLVADLKYDKYYKNAPFKNFDQISKRIGFVSLVSDNFGLKGFATASFTPPSLYQIDFANGAKKDLDPEKNQLLSFESVYENANHKITLFITNSKTSNGIVLTPTGFQNNSQNTKNHGIVLDYLYRVDGFNQININAFNFNSNDAYYASPHQGVILKAFQKFDKIRFYEELIFKRGYNHNGQITLDNSYNASIGGIYQFSRDIELGLKYENIFNDDMSIAYNKNGSYTTINNSRPKASASLKWTF